MDFATLRAIGITLGSVANGASSGAIAIQISQAGHLGRLVISSSITKLYELSVTSINLNGDELLSGTMPAVAFGAEASDSPLFGHYVKPSDVLTITVYNNGGAAAVVNVAFTGYSPWLFDNADRLYNRSGKGTGIRDGRSLIGIGKVAGQAGTSVAAASTSTITMAPQESGIAGRLWLQGDDNDLSELYVSNVLCGNLNYVPAGVKIPALMFAFNARNSPVFGFLFAPGTDVQVTVGNDDGANAQIVYAGFNSL